MQPIRVLNMFTVMNRGGAETMVMNYYRHLDREKVQFDFLVHREEPGAYEKEILSLGGRIYRMLPIYPQNFSKYKKEIRKFFQQHPEYRIVHSHMSELGFFALREAQKQGIPVRICHAHNAPHGFDSKMLVRNYFKYRMKPYLTHCFICGQEAGNFLFGRKNSDKFIMMNNAIDAESYTYNEVMRREARKEFFIEENFVVGHVGRFNRQKNHSFLLAIFAALCQMEPSAKLMLIGEGSGLDAVKSQVKELNLENKVIFTGGRPDVNRLLQVMDVFLFPSLFEGLPVTMVEAQAAGLPCVISSSIPSECIMTDLVTVRSLSDSPSVWADVVLRQKGIPRKSQLEKIRARGFDVVSAASWLEHFYLEQYRQAD